MFGSPVQARNVERPNKDAVVVVGEAQDRMAVHT